MMIGGDINDIMGITIIKSIAPFTYYSIITTTGFLQDDEAVWDTRPFASMLTESSANPVSMLTAGSGRVSRPAPLGSLVS